MRLLCLLYVLLLVNPFQVYSQDGHYGTEHYGIHSNFLGGAVTGSVEDLGAVYYNPGRLSLIEDPSFIISARAFQLQKLVIEDAIGDNINLSESDIGTAPNMLAGSFSLGNNDQHKLAYSLITRFESDLEFSIRTTGEGDIIDDLSGEELYAGEVSWNRALSERWLGFTWSYNAWSNVSIGVTNFFTRRSQEASFKTQLQALSPNEDISFLYRNRQNEFTHYGMLWKAGIAADFSPFLLGMTITTPKVHLAGSGRYTYEDFFSGIDTDPELSGNVFLTNDQRDLTARHRSPLSVGIGAGLQLEKVKFHTSLEWYSGVPRYSILSMSPFVGRITGDTITTRLVDRLKSVVNFGLGAECLLSDRISLYGSFSTDNSYVTASVNRFVEFANRSNNSVMRADLMHFSAGAVIRTGKVELTLGSIFSFAEQELLRPVDLPEEDGNIIFGSGQTATVNWQRYRLIFGFSLPVSNKEK